jgi:hypothetical protein
MFLIYVNGTSFPLTVGTYRSWEQGGAGMCGRAASASPALLAKKTKRPPIGGLFSSRDDRSTDQFSLLLMLLNVLESFVPRPFTTVMIATEMPAAINPYSIAVAPESSRANRWINLCMCVPFFL